LPLDSPMLMGKIRTTLHNHIHRIKEELKVNKRREPPPSNRDDDDDDCDCDDKSCVGKTNFKNRKVMFPARAKTEKFMTSSMSSDESIHTLIPEVDQQQRLLPPLHVQATSETKKLRTIKSRY